MTVTPVQGWKCDFGVLNDLTRKHLSCLQKGHSSIYCLTYQTQMQLSGNARYAAMPTPHPQSYQHHFPRISEDPVYGTSTCLKVIDRCPRGKDFTNRVWKKLSSTNLFFLGVGEVILFFIDNSIFQGSLIQCVL